MKEHNKPELGANPIETEGNSNEEIDLNERLSELILPLAERCKNGERFVFPGITAEAMNILHEENEAMREDYPEVYYDLDALLLKFKDQGFKVVAGRDSVSAMLMPGDSNDRDDMLRPGQLEITTDMDPILMELVALDMASKKNKIGV